MPSYVQMNNKTAALALYEVIPWLLLETHPNVNQVFHVISKSHLHVVHRGKMKEFLVADKLIYILDKTEIRNKHYNYFHTLSHAC